MCRASGIGTYIRNIIPFLTDSFDITLLGCEEDIKAFPWADKVKIIEASSKIYSVSEQIELFRKIPDCDVFWSPHYNVPVLPIRAKKRIVTVHDAYHLAAESGIFSPVQRMYAKFVMRRAVSVSDAVLTVSEFSKAEILKYCPSEPAKIKVVFNAVDEKQFSGDKNSDVIKKYSLPEDYILFVGNVKPNKNLITLLKALELMSGVNLVIVGRKDGFITGDSAVAEMVNGSESLKSRVFFTGYADDKDIPSIYASASVFVFPSLYEGFGIPPLEAQACGCPVVSSPAASLREVCGGSVIYCDPMSSEDIAEKVMKVRGSAELRAELIEKGYDNIRRFGWQKSAEQIRDIIKGM
ncbi:glycosyltransferase family 1 protein [Geovibrio thiophilus]|uniref:Glycosyltransferase family 1 protein n=2 Tax=Geovibrio thiophilus TaxID=139438 RepID=A0A410K2D1_9BACT|nr:glycosyltransferase family 1 protein [Geovibrio thiophilus]